MTNFDYLKSEPQFDIFSDVAKEAFSEYLNETNYDSRQIYFVNQIIEYLDGKSGRS